MDEWGSGSINPTQGTVTIYDRCSAPTYYGTLLPNVGDLTAAYHTFGLYWRNDGSAHGSMQFYVDGAPFSSPEVLQSDAGIWDNGIYLVSGAGASTTPFYVDWIRVYKEVPSATLADPETAGWAGTGGVSR